MTETHGLDDFLDIDTSDFCLSPSDQPWMSEVFDDIKASQLSHDDLLTDAVSELMTCKTELPDIGLLSENNELLVEVDNCAKSCENAGSFPIVHVTDQDKSGNSSGYASGVHRETPHTIKPKLKLESYNTIDAVVRISEDKLEPKQPAVFRALSTISSGGNNRVRFIVRPHQIVNVESKNKPCFENSTGIKRVRTISRSRLEQSTFNQRGMENSSVSLTNKVSIPFQFAKTYDPKIRQGTVTASQSSSDSDVRDGFEDDDVAAYSEVCPDTKHLDTFEFSSSFPALSRSKHMTVVPKGCGFNRSGSITPKLQKVNGPPFEELSDSDYIHQSRLNSHHTLFRGQVSQSGLLVLSDEEKRTMLAEGYTIPTRLPLTKQEERNLKKVRRKIKNKLSAQESRRKKKEYVEALERKLNVCVQENLDLKRRNDSLENNNRSLLGQLRLMQQLLNKPKNQASNSITTPGANNTTTHSDSPKSGSRNSNGATTGGGGSASTCLMVFALCFAALLVGQPTDLHYRTSLDAGLTFGPQQHHGFWNKLIAKGPSGLVSGSLHEIGYTWSSNHADHPDGSPNRIRLESAGIQSNWPGDSSHWVAVANARGRRMGRINRAILGNANVSQADGRHLAHADHRQNYPNLVATSRSRLLGSADEMEERVAPQKSLWAYLFGVTWQRSSVAVCARREHSASLDPGPLFNLDSNQLDNTPIEFKSVHNRTSVHATVSLPTPLLSVTNSS
ncbi:hypothetical protein EG68_03445 [Paragonimus skrjabini miyazakii]|uniref:BZIP domain-containing protein n=1 Tax=Paragonimus skrjabini miyazakii TaxID=59628 RepID=A0A8S9Z154_9TREM|nr:hypothetical protein EG68_03445 [Paragonimus skrjabini miyazakii]